MPKEAQEVQTTKIKEEVINRLPLRHLNQHLSPLA